MDGREHHLSIFVFGCSLCGATPPPLLLRDYLSGWKAADPSRLASLLSCLTGALADLKLGAERKPQTNLLPWISPAFSDSTEVLAEILNRAGKVFRFQAIPGLTVRKAGHFLFPMRCPLCKQPAGPRRPGKYFEAWDRASKVQVANLLYDSALVLWGIVGELPDYLSGKAISAIDLLRKGLKFSLTQIGLSECPVCGRFTTTLYGRAGDTTGQFCRWCLEEAQWEIGAGRGFFGMAIGEDWLSGDFKVIPPEPPPIPPEDRGLTGPKTGEERL